MKFFEDIQVGDVTELGRHTFTAEDIKSFAHRFDPQRFHIDEEEAARSHFGALCASGWHTASMWMRLAADQRRGEIEGARLRGQGPAQWGPALGFRELKWLKPVYAGDTIAYRAEVLEARASQSRPEFGLVVSLATGDNQKGERVISFVSTIFVQRRVAGP